jgi:TfoX/Sxy family transcriptional regulator of competence genes
MSSMAGRPTKGSIPKPEDASKDAWRALLPDDPRVSVRPMFGNLAAFVNGNMFTGLFGDDVFVRLPEDERDAVLKAGGKPFEPMPGRGMKEYVVLPSSWRTKPAAARQWIEGSLAFAATLPAKAPGGKKK